MIKILICLQVTTYEQKNKTLTQELQCQRHNAESAKQHAEQKLKQREKELQQDLSQREDMLKDMDRHHQETKNKLTQELNKVK